MAIFNDTFTDTNGTNIQDHTPDTGTGWSVVWRTDTGQNYAVESNQCDPQGGLGDGMIYSADGTYPSADYEIEATMVGVDSGDDPIFLFVRIQDQENMYGVYLLDETNGCSLYKKVSGTWTALGSAFNAPAAGSVVKLEIIGTSLKFYDDTVEIASATDSAISAAGKAGIGAGGGAELVNSGDDANAAGPVWDSLTVTDLGGGGSSIKTDRTISQASVKAWNSIAAASVKTRNTISNV